MKLITRGAAAPILAAALLSACGGGETPPALSVKPLSADLKSLALDRPTALAASLRKASGPVDIWVTLDLPGLARARLPAGEGRHEHDGPPRRAVGLGFFCVGRQEAVSRVEQGVVAEVWRGADQRQQRVLDFA